MIRPILILLTLSAAPACNTTPQAVEHSTNGEVTVSLLTTWADVGDQCKLWRVEADGKQVYVARCGGDLRAYEHHTTTTSTGKTTTVHHHEVEALTLEAQR